MKRRDGFTLTEVMIASSLVIVVFIIIYAVFDTSDKAYWTQVPLKEAQIATQKTLEAVSYETQETGLDFVWAAPITGESLPAGVQQAMVWASARSSGGQFMTDSSFQPLWQKTVALVPLTQTDGTVTLTRFEFAPPPPASPTCTPRISVTASPAQLTLSWLDGGGAVAATSSAIPRSLGIKQLPNLPQFSITPVTSITDASGAVVSVALIKIRADVSARAPKGKVTVTIKPSIRGRN